MKKALLVGINQYPDAPLRGCVQDAAELARILEFNADDTANFNVRLETNIPRKSTLRALIVDLFSGENEIALFYFSGHGYIDKYGMGYLVTPDHRPFDEGISMNDLLTYANNSRSKNKIIILDCCHGGAMTAPALIPGSAGHINQGITVLTASREDEAAMEVRGKGIFTNLLLEAIKGGAADLNGDITPGSIYAFIDQALGPWDQRPIFKTNVSGFTCLRSAAPKINMAELKKITEYFPQPDTLFPLDPSFEYTNDPQIVHQYIAPFAQPEHITVFKTLQKMQSAGLVEPCDEAHMYWAAMNNKSCRLTPLGAHYWRLVNEKKI